MNKKEDVFARNTQNRVRRMPERGAYDRETIYAIIDEALICHVSFVQDDQPFIIPINHGRDGDSILLHGSRNSRLMKHIASGAPVCLAFTLVDGLVLARSTFHSSMHYRSVVVFGHGAAVDEKNEKLAAFAVLTEHLARGRWKDSRPVTAKEMAATAVVRIHIESASAKLQNGPVEDEEADYALPLWAGVIPFEVTAKEPVADPRLSPGIPMPEYLKGYQRKRKEQP